MINIATGKFKAIITDIEGTTSSISFVKDVLFPYASSHLEDYITKNQDNPELIRLINEIIDIEKADQTLSMSEKQQLAINILQNWIKLDLKIKPLKDLQGLIWEAGYRNQDFYGHIYDDAYEDLKKCHAQGIKLYVYSSGSVYAQKLLFGHTKFGDLNYLFSGNFDTTVGNKREASSYVNIVAAINKQIPGIKLNEILFLTDIQEELDAALACGIEGIRIDRTNSAAQAC